METTPQRPRSDRSPILVTGVPRSGTTWLARLLATARGTVLAGREPMNPRGSQYGLARTLTGWTQLRQPNPRQLRVLRSAYRGLNPWVYSRYGRRQLLGPLPWSRMIVKDPFAMLSVASVQRVTGATVILVYRHPGAVLSSYRRMGWQPDVGEVRSIVHLAGSEGLDVSDIPQSPDAPNEVEAMAYFWAALHVLALAEAPIPTPMLVVSHEELATLGPKGGQRVFSELGLQWSVLAAEEMSRASGSPVDAHELHNFDRPSASVAGAWRSKVADDEIEDLERLTIGVRTRLEARRLKLSLR